MEGEEQVESKRELEKREEEKWGDARVIVVGGWMSPLRVSKSFYTFIDYYVICCLALM